MSMSIIKRLLREPSEKCEKLKEQEKYKETYFNNRVNGAVYEWVKGIDKKNVYSSKQ